MSVKKSKKCGLRQGSANWAIGQIWSTACCGAHYKLHTKPILLWVFRFLSGWGKDMPGIFYDIWKWHEIHISVSMNKVLLAHRYTQSSAYCPQPFMPQSQIWEVPVETPADPQNLKYFLTWPFTEVCCPLVKRFGNRLLDKVTPTVSMLLNFPFKVLMWLCSPLQQFLNWLDGGTLLFIHILRNTSLGNAILEQRPSKWGHKCHRKE